MISTNDIETINGELDNRFNQSIDWFLNSEYYTANIPLKFFFANEANQLESTKVPWGKGRICRHDPFLKGDKLVLYYANEVYLNTTDGYTDKAILREYNLVKSYIEQNNVPLKDILFLGNIYEGNNNQTKLAQMLGLTPKQILLIDYYELQTFFFHRVLGCEYNKSYNPTSSKGIKYLFGKIDKPIRIFAMYKLWEKGLLDNAVTGCLIKDSDIEHVAEEVCKEYYTWFNKELPFDNVVSMLRQYQGSPDNVRFYYFSMDRFRTDSARFSISKINHCPSYPYDHTVIFSNSRASLIPETYYYKGHTHFVTEKTHKAIYNHHPFVLLSTAGILDILKHRGYKTFDGICNEIYDKCSNDRKRLDLVIEASEQIITSEKHDELYSITNHNFSNLETNALRTVELLNTTIKNVFRA